MRIKQLTMAIAFSTFLLFGCSKIKRVSGEEFIKEYNLRDAQTMYSAEYLGEKDGKVYMKKRSMSTISSDKWSEKILYTEIKNLAASIKEELLSLDKKYND